MRLFNHMLFIVFILVFVFALHSAMGATNAMGDDVYAKNGDYVRCYISYKTVGTFYGNWYDAVLLDSELADAWLIDFTDSALYQKEQLGHSTIQNVRSNDCLIIKNIELGAKPQTEIPL